MVRKTLCFVGFELYTRVVKIAIVVNCYKHLIRSHVSYINLQGRRETMCFIRKHLKTNEGIENTLVIGNIVVVIGLLI